MVIGELLVKLGFQVDNPNVLPDTEEKIKKTAFSAGKLAAAVDVVAGGLLYMLDTAVNAGTALQRFVLTTGLSSEALQQWQYRAQLAGVSGQAMAEAVKAIQLAGARVIMGGENVQAWALLGIDPRQNPFTVLDQLNKALIGVDQNRVALARSIVNQAGIGDDIFQLLRRRAPAPLPQNFIVQPKDIQNLGDLNAQWKDFEARTDAIKNIFSSELAPSFTLALQTLERLVNKGAEFTNWLRSGTEGANNAKSAMGALGTGVLALAGGLSTIAGLNFAAMALGIDLTFAPLIPAAAAMAAIVAGYVYFSQHQKTGDNFDPSNPLGRPRRFGQNAQKFGYEPLTDQLGEDDAVGPGLSGVLRFPGRQGGASILNHTTIQVVNHVTIPGSENPAATGRSVADALKQQNLYTGLSGQPTDF